jgi:mono/diheme cytochrome c family protein
VGEGRHRDQAPEWCESRDVQGAGTSHAPPRPDTIADQEVWVLKRGKWYIVGTAVVLLFLLSSGALSFIYSGIYQIAASEPHILPFRWAVQTLSRRSIERHAADVVAPSLRRPDLIQRGVVVYQQQCLICHGAPGVERPLIGRGMNPNPPRLAVDAVDWSDGEIYWIIRHGIKMGGMPAFIYGLSDDDIWATTAFVRRLPELSEEEYARMLLAVEGQIDPSRVTWIDDEAGGWTRLASEGNPARGGELLGTYGCGTCHMVPGVSGAVGKVGAPLDQWAERHYIAGTLLNTPENLVEWIVDPQGVEPGTAMPDLGVSQREALDIAAYLFTLGETPRALARVTGQVPE